MRLSLLVLNILIGASLSFNTPDLAAAKSAKTGKSKSQISYQGHNTKKTPTNPGDVWTRIRLGMKLPNATAVQTGLPLKNDLAELDDLSNTPVDSCNGLKKLEARRNRHYQSQRLTLTHLQRLHLCVTPQQ